MQITRRIGSFLLVSEILIIFCTSCSSRQKGYSVSLAKKNDSKVSGQSLDSNQNSNPAVVYDDDEFFDLIQKIESGEYEPEPVREEEVVEPEPIVIPEGDILEIKENLFITQINDIYFNFDSYKNKTIIVEGMFTYFISYFDDAKCPAVYRLGPGCCGNDGWGGFLLDYAGKYPEENEWIRVIGTPYIKETNGFADLYLKVMSIEVKTERGAEFVRQ